MYPSLPLPLPTKKSVQRFSKSDCLENTRQDARGSLGQSLGCYDIAVSLPFGTFQDKVTHDGSEKSGRRTAVVQSLTSDDFNDKTDRKYAVGVSRRHVDE